MRGVLFLFLSGVLNKNTQMLGVSLLVIFLYGSLIWGILPLQEGISWESHLFGALAGVVLAYVFRKDGQQKKTFDWEEEDETYPVEFWNMTPEEIEAYTPDNNAYNSYSIYSLSYPYSIVYYSVV